MKITYLSIKGMECEACAGHVTNALQGLDGVEKADVSLAGNTASVTYDPLKVTLAQMREAVADEGYEASI